MAVRELTIQIRTDFETEEADEQMVNNVKQAARHLLTVGLLMSGRRKPQVMVQGGDWICAPHEIALLDDVLQEIPDGGEDNADQANT